MSSRAIIRLKFAERGQVEALIAARAAVFDAFPLPEQPRVEGFTLRTRAAALRLLAEGAEAAANAVLTEKLTAALKNLKGET